MVTIQTVPTVPQGSPVWRITVQVSTDDVRISWFKHEAIALQTVQQAVSMGYIVTCDRRIM